jgi:carbon-monoxide dehydrogenase large subunit
MMTGVYDIPNARVELTGVFTNKQPTEPYRGAGRPEAAYLIERAMDVLADELGLDPAEVRQRNFIPPEKFPYTTPINAKYDSGEYARALNRALELVDYQALRAEQAQRRQNGGKLMGIGLACYVEICGFGPWEAGSVTMDEAGQVTVLSGTSPHGQGHQTTWAQIVADLLQIPMEDVTVKHGDTAVVPRGIGTFGSRSTPVGGSAVFQNTETVREQAKAIAAHLLEAAVPDMTLSEGRFHVQGVPERTVSWQEVAQAAHSDDLPEELQGSLAADEDFQPKGETYPFGAHVAVVEIDPETGVVQIVRYLTVDDCGRVINPLLVEGQVHGGLAQGIGQALFEAAVFDETGNLVSGSLMDYALPKADNFPFYETHRTETPSPLNPLGAKGIGEAATIGSTPTIVNAVVDALSHLGVRHLDMPLTAPKVWQAIQQAKK